MEQWEKELLEAEVFQSVIALVGLYIYLDSSE